MSVYTDSASRLGKKPGGTDDRELMLTEFGEMVLQAHAQTQDFKDFVFTKSIRGAKADDFPVIGRKRDATEHEPGEIILGGTIEHNNTTITVDKMLVDSVFIAEIDELLLHYDVRQAYSRQLGESLGNTKSQRVARTIVLASRQAALGAQGHVTPIRIGSATIKTDAAKMELAHFRAVQFIKENDIGGGLVGSFWPWAQYLLLARYTGIDAEVTTGTGDRGEGTVDRVAGVKPRGTNFIPNTNVTTGLTKYQGDFTNTAGFAANSLCAGMLQARGLSVWSGEQPNRLGHQMIASELYGLGVLRPECAIEFLAATSGTNVVNLDA